MTVSGSRTARARFKCCPDANDDDHDLYSRRQKPNFRSCICSDRNSSSIGIFNIDLKFILGLSVCAFFIIMFLSTTDQASRCSSKTYGCHAVFCSKTHGPPSSKLRFLKFSHRNFLNVSVSSVVGFLVCDSFKVSLYRGTYNSHVYVGILARTPRSLVAGLMWIGVKDGSYFMRHVCQDSDDLIKYDWTLHNGSDFGHQVIVDHGLTFDR